jgi:transposase
MGSKEKSPKKKEPLPESLNEAQAEIERLRQEVDQLQKKVDELEKQLSAKKKPHWAKPNLNKDKRKSKKIGAKRGHPPHVRRPVREEAGEEVTWVPEICMMHGDLPFPSKWHEHSQIDIPVFQPIVITKHVVGWSWCAGCKAYVSAKHEKLSYTKYGPRLHAYVAYLKLDLGMTFGKIQRLLEEQYRLKISTGVLSEMIGRCGDKFKSEYETMKKNLKNTTHLHADETGWRNGGNNEWLWSFSNDQVSVFSIHPSRAQKVVEEILGKTYRGVLISDFYCGYNRIICEKQKCWTHLLRELHVLKEKHPKNREVWYFSERLKRFFKRACDLKEENSKGREVDRQISRLETDTIKFLAKRFENKRLKTLVKRMTKYYFELYTFIRADVEPTNNPAEREIRPAVLMRKTSYCNRSEWGKQNQAILMSIIATSKKQGRNFINYAAEKLVSP